MAKKVLTDAQRLKEDNNNDLFFYSEPRFVHHLDEGFRYRLTELYRKRIPINSVILDLMSSWVSHLPKDIQYERVIGHGLNLKELEKNNRLDSYWIQNLNQDQILPLNNSSVDVCLMVAAWQYLQYPEEISLEIKRILKPNGQLIVSFSNRAFWTKAPRVWLESSDSERINYICEVLTSQGWEQPDYILENQTNKNLFNSFFANSDPFISVIATNIETPKC